MRSRRPSPSRCIRIVQYNREDYTRVSSDRAKIGHVTIGKRLARGPPLLKIDTKQCFTDLFNGLFKHQAASLDFIGLLKLRTNLKLYRLCHKKLNVEINLMFTILNMSC
jgi:hypothetical protein